MYENLTCWFQNRYWCIWNLIEVSERCEWEGGIRRRKNFKFYVRYWNVDNSTPSTQQGMSDHRKFDRKIPTSGSGVLAPTPSTKFWQHRWLWVAFGLRYRWFREVQKLKSYFFCSMTEVPHDFYETEMKSRVFSKGELILRTYRSTPFEVGGHKILYEWFLTQSKRPTWI